MKKFFSTNKFKHGTMATIFTALFIALIVVANMIMGMLNDRFPSMDIDLTTNKIHTLSETAAETAKDANYKTEIILIGTQEEYEENQVYASSGFAFEYSQVASLCEKMVEANPELISMKYVDPDLDPTVVKDYPTDKLVTGNVIIRTEKRYKILDVFDLFPIYQNDQGGYAFYTSVDGAIANATSIVNLEFVPVIAVATGHNELLKSENRTSFDTLMNNNGFEVIEFNVLTEEIPQDTRIIMLPSPSTDYSEEEIDKIEEFLSVEEENRSLLVTASPDMSDTPNLDRLLADWGIVIGDGVAIETDKNNMMSQSPVYMFVNYTDCFDNKDYNYLLSIGASPIEALFVANNNIATEPILKTANTGYVLTESEVPENPETSSVATGYLGYRTNNIEGDNTQTSVVVLGDYASLLPTYLSNSTFGNSKFITDTLRYVAKIQDVNIGIYIEETQVQVADIVAPFATMQIVGLYIFTIGVPAIILIIGLVVFLRRRHL